MAIRIGRRANLQGHSPADPFTDLLFNALIGIMLLFVIALIFLNPAKKEGTIELDAEYIITVTWEDNSPDDIDTWIEDPKGDVAWFRQKNAGLVHLDRDDRGMLKDTLIINGEVIENPLNQEVVAIRGIVPGEFTVNLHYYASETGKPVDVKVRVAKVNPVYEIIWYGTVILERKGVEKTAVRFTLNGDGSIREINTLQKRLVKYH